MSRRGENHLRQCSSSSNSVYIVVAVGCLACATRTNREVYVQTLFASKKRFSRGPLLVEGGWGFFEGEGNLFKAGDFFEGGGCLPPKKKKGEKGG